MGEDWAETVPVRVGSELREQTSWTPSPRSTPIASYSQNAEDVRLWRVFENVNDGFYVDIGAAGPTWGSVTRLFYDNGWSGINVEPGPSFEELDSARSRDVNLNLAVARADGTSSFFVTYPDVGMSTLDPDAHSHLIDEVKRTEEIVVPTRRLESILREHAVGRTIHFLKIDVEGAEEEVIASSEWAAFRPIVVVVEAVQSWTTTPTHARWEHHLVDSDYEFAAFDGINRFYVAGEHRELIPALAYPISPLDRFVRGGGPSAQEESTQKQLETARRDLENLAQTLQQTRAELAQARYDLAAVYLSRTWRAGRLVAAAASPLSTLSRLRPPRRRRKLTPDRALAAYTAPGEPWHYAQDSPKPRGRRDDLEQLISVLGDFETPLDRGRADQLRATIDRLDWVDDTSLHERRRTWEERQAILEAQSLAELRLTDAKREEAVGATRSRGVLVVDVRSLQDPNYSTRGVGFHGRGVLAVVTALASQHGHELVLLANAELPELPSDVVEPAGRVVYEPYSLRDDDVRLFVELSPMTETCAPAMPFLADPSCPTASVVYDFIPSRFPEAYLTTPAARLENRVRVEALRSYDLLLPISQSTETVIHDLLGDERPTVVTGVADPLAGVQPQPAARAARYVLAPVGGDPRKNAPAALAGLAQYRNETGSRLRLLFTGTLTSGQQDALEEMAHSLRLPEGTVDCLGYVARQDLADLYAGAELVVVPSIIEGFSIPVTEAVRYGTPVVASDVPAHVELVGRGPWLAHPRDAASFAHAIRETVSHRDDVLRAQQMHVGDSAEPDAVHDRVASAVRDLLRPEPPADIPRRLRPRPHIAVVSPFPPQQSGVADYTSFTFRQIAKYADLDVYTQPGGVEGPWELRPISSGPYIGRRYDAVVGVLGNSHYNFPALDLLGAFGGAAIAHDNRMFEAYRFGRGDAWIAGLFARSGHFVRPEEIAEMADDLDRLPSIGYEMIARQASPLIVHGTSLADRIERETFIRPLVVPFVPYNVPSTDGLDEAARREARRALELDDDLLHVATLGIVDRRTKGTDLIVSAMSWFKEWKIPAHLHVVGPLPDAERDALQALVRELGVDDLVSLRGRVGPDELTRYLLGVDVAVQLRMSSILSLSGSVADCIAFGVPTITTPELVEELVAPPYVAAVGPAPSSLLIAEAISEFRTTRRDSFDAIESDRRGYLQLRSVDAYARGVLHALGLGIG
jgi:FkbM family methyltransferase